MSGNEKNPKQMSGRAFSKFAKMQKIPFFHEKIEFSDHFQGSKKHIFGRHLFVKFFPTIVFNLYFDGKQKISSKNIPKGVFKMRQNAKKYAILTRKMTFRAIFRGQKFVFWSAFIPYFVGKQ